MLIHLYHITEEKIQETTEKSSETRNSSEFLGKKKTEKVKLHIYRPN